MVTDPGSTINSGGSGLNIINFDTAIAASADSMITVTTNGTINSGTTLNPSGSQPQGIVAGYYGASTTAIANTNVNGTAVVNNNANITAAAGYGIDAYNYGNGNVTVNEGAIDWTDFTGRVMYGLKQEGKHQFLRDLSRNVLRGQVEAAKAGSWIGTPPYAYRIEGAKKHKRLIVDDATRVKVVRHIFAEFVEQGQSMSEIARRLTADGIRSSGGCRRWRPDAVKVILFTARPGIIIGPSVRIDWMSPASACVFSIVATLVSSISICSPFWSLLST